jgi:hypothetical protein
VKVLERPLRIGRLAALLSCLVCPWGALDAVTLGAGYPPLMGTGNGPADLVLIYQGALDRLAWTSGELQSYVTYRDVRSGRERWLFDGFLFLEFRDGRGARYIGQIEGRSATRAEWTWLADRLFARGVAIDALDKAIQATSSRIGWPARQRQVFLGLPEPVIHQKDWGDLDGRSLDFDLPEDRLAATRWYLQEALRRWRARAPAHLQLRGFYWVAEDASDSRSILPRVAELVHREGRELIWIPYWRSPQAASWRALGFDRAYLQPNHFFKPAIPDSRLDEACAAARASGMGLEVEFDGRALSDEAYRPRMGVYLERFGAAGALAAAPLAWYEGGGAILRMATASEPSNRRLYDDLARVVMARQARADAVIGARTKKR